MPRTPMVALAAVLATLPFAVSSAATLPANIAAAATSPARAGQAKDDARRHGPEILAQIGVRPGETVIDLIPGGGYWTRLFSKAVGPAGHVYDIWPNPYAAEAGGDVRADKAMAGSKDFPNLSVAVEPAAQLTAPQKVDIVFTSQNYHDYPDKFMGHIDPSVLNRMVFAALKPGGVYFIIDHVAAEGQGMRQTDTLHRIEPATVKAQVTAAGFQFVGSSNLLANPADDHTKAVFDRSIRGRTDQFIFKFRKP